MESVRTVISLRVYVVFWPSSSSSFRWRALLMSCNCARHADVVRTAASFLACSYWLPIEKVVDKPVVRLYKPPVFLQVRHLATDEKNELVKLQMLKDEQGKAKMMSSYGVCIPVCRFPSVASVLAALDKEGT